MKKPLWTPSQERVSKANLTKFIGLVNEKFGKRLTNYDDLYAWSVENIPDFGR